MALVNADRIKSELNTFDIGCGDDILDKMLEQCLCNRLQGHEIVLEWVAFSTTKGGLKLSLNTLEQFEHEVLNKKYKAKPAIAKREESHNRTRDINSLHDLYPLQFIHTQSLSYIISSKRSAALIASPGLLMCSASFFPSVTPSQKYSQRGGRGEVVSTFGAVQGTRWAGRKGQTNGVQLELLEGSEDSLINNYKYMFQRLRDVRNVLTEKIEELGEELRTNFNIEEFSPVSLPAQDSVIVLGQVCCDSNGKLNSQSVLLEAGPDQGGRQVPVDLSELRDYSLFPGQVVVMEGMNTSGRKFVASKLFEGVPLPFYSTPIKQEMDMDIPDEQFLVMVACGPYTPSDGLTFDPLVDLINVIARDRPDVCILLGPFVDSKHEQIELFFNIYIVEGTKGVGCRLVFVPSQRDVHHHFIYPQPPFILPDLSKDDAKRMTLVPDPCTLLIDGVTFGLTSTDILFHMGAEEISCASGSDRFSRILKHMLTQRNYYPLYPPVEEVNMDYEKFQGYGQMPLSPDVLIVPSELRFFIKDVIGCVCVNPGRLTKGQVGGTYGRLLIQRSAPSIDGKRVSPCVAGQVVKI
uniref:DNA polymerase alpha subunit B n=1 Tax=Oncorhynchus tshawytscha TaxID=74940 RepID=A0A8C8I4T0_ONCTS